MREAAVHVTQLIVILKELQKAKCSSFGFRLENDLPRCCRKRKKLIFLNLEILKVEPVKCQIS